MNYTLIGTIALFPYNFVPQHWAECAGQTLAINQYEALFALLGANFGGDGVRTFRLPDLREKVPLEGLRYAMCIEGIFPSQG